MTTKWTLGHSEPGAGDSRQKAQLSIATPTHPMAHPPISRVTPGVKAPPFRRQRAPGRLPKPHGHPAETTALRKLRRPSDAQMEIVYVSPRLHPEYELASPQRKLRVEREGEIFVVSDDFSSVYGTAENLDDALRDYFLDLFDYVALLEQRESILAPGLRQELAELRRHVVSKS